MQENLNDYLDNQKQLIEENLRNYLQHLSIPSQLKESMIYSLEAGGKRLRPILLFASCQAYGGNVSKTLSSAAALEMIHTYSLIHDDLPAMDDDDYRRGKPTNHKVFDEATAILAGDALLTYSFEIITNDPVLTDQQKVKLTGMMATVAGPRGMVGGQILDMEAEINPVSLEELEHIHALKTGELLQFAVFAGAYLSSATDEQLKALKDFAHYLGLIFQVQDDILDVVGDPDKIGKAIGSDELNQKSTYPKLLGIDGAIEQKQKYVNKAKEALKKADALDTTLNSLIDYFSHRDH
ncbi:geranyl transferase [Virgibacillus indicus]|uniref:Farnesyl diphosphate synthase n=1 Tax=Virgibacillus indicus TaxID=2024554 RepID=A0A265NDX3_9BACI|nr:farnesyl diphosphate synthase [Virgibacillus indicus]OZU90011.1 geranyl transferase [Virgibacillus indicus]